MAAAVSDYIPEFTQEGKLKKEMLGESWEMKLKQNIDILNTIDKKDITTIAFKAEMDANTATTNASKLLDTKDVDAVCLNLLKDSSSFGSDTNKVEFIQANGVAPLKDDDKLSVSFEILQHSKKL